MCEACYDIDHSIDLVLLHDKLAFIDGFNFDTLQESISTKLNISFLKNELKDYHDSDLVKFLEFGWPVGFQKGSIDLKFKKCRNHTGARSFAKDIEKYILKEKSYGAILGPFKSNPFIDSLFLSPLNSVPKSLNERRVIVDLSFPKGASVNDGIDKHFYLTDKIDLHYPNIDNLAEIVKSKGRNCLMYKRDLKRAYRQFAVDPKDYNLLGYSWRNHIFIDCVLPMGLRSSAYICQRITDAVSFIVQKHGFQVINYFDDFAGAETRELAFEAFEMLGVVIKDCGLEESLDKAAAPSCRMSFLGVWFNSEEMTLEVTPDRILEIKTLLVEWLSKDLVSQKEVQSLVGKLNFIAACVKPGRVFISRILNFLREFKDSTMMLALDIEFYKDLEWWLKFLELYNGISILSLEDWSDPDSFFASDACLVGCGGICGDQYFHCSYPPFISILALHINALELLTVIVCLKKWAKKGKKICIFCDNLVSVQVINSGKTRSKFLQACLRELCFVCAIVECEIKAFHLAGEDNRLSDLLSRWNMDDKYQFHFFKETEGLNLREIFINESLFRFQNEW